MAGGFLRSLREAVLPPRFDCIQVEVSSRCAARCRYCPAKGAGESRLLDDATFDRLAPSFGDAALVFLQGWGEPLLHPRLLDFAARARSEGARTGFTTNGVLLAGERAERVLDAGVDVVGVSLAGAGAATHDRFREGCPFDLVDGNMREFRGRRERRRGLAPALHVAYTLFAGNRADLPLLPALAEAWGARELAVSPYDLVLSADLEAESVPARPDLWAETETLAAAAAAEAGRRGIAFRYHRPHAERRSTCTENVRRSIYVTAGGEIVPCAIASAGRRAGPDGVHRFRGRAVPIPDFVFGDLSRAILSAIADSEPARAFRAAHPAPCLTCHKLHEG